MGLSLLLVANVDLEELSALKAPPVLCRRDGPDPAMSQAPSEPSFGFLPGFLRQGSVLVLRYSWIP